MNRYSAVAAAAVMLQLPGPSYAADPGAAQSLAQRIEASVAPLYKPGEPGVSIIVVKDGKTVFRKAYGMADVAKGTPLTPETSLRIGSMTKQFTSTAILMLADEGKLSLGDDITKYLPDYPAQGKKVTIEHLLTHTSGIVSYSGKSGYMAGMAKDVSVAGMIDSFKNDPLQFEPGTAWAYNNSGYYLLGAIIEKVSGMPYAKFVEQRIFVPLGMEHTAYEGFERDKAPRAAGHLPGPDGFQPGKPISMNQAYAAGALVSTVDDLARWDAALSSGKLLKAASWQQAVTPYKLANGKSTGYGYGWEIGTLRGSQKVAHGGAINGFRTYALRLPAEKVYVAVLSNTERGITGPEIVAAKVAAIAMGNPYPEYTPVTVAPALLDAYAGAYRVEGKPNRIFRHVKDGLLTHRPGGSATRLQAFSDTSFFIPGTTDWLEFKRDAKGEVSQVVTHFEEVDASSERIGPVAERKAVPLTDAAFDARAGRYQIAPGFFMELSRSGDRYFAQPTGQQRIEIFPMSEKAFFSNDIDVELRFDNPADLSELVLDQGGRQLKGKKLS
jgi:CubicO group peptidase (beta-lactamase class C family)